MEQCFLDVWKKFLKSKIGREIINEEIHKYIHGGNNKTVLSYFFNRDFSDGEVQKLGEEKESMYRDMCLKDEKMFKLVKGLPEFLNKLKEAGIPITIATGAPISNVKFYFEHLNLGKWFDINKVVYTDGSFKGKPEPDIFLKAAKNINVDIENCVVFEDAILGIEAAKRANAAKIIAVSSINWWSFLCYKRFYGNINRGFVNKNLITKLCIETNEKMF